MKKFTLSVTKPCHEDWEQMTPDQRGRFCASCQKSVVDFTAMSDRQVADYFKKSSVSTCGRFYRDQLDREIIVPKKGLPWLRYFFQFTWPAFLLLLKSCGQKDKITSKAVVEERKAERPFFTMGVALPQITPVDTAKVISKKPENRECSTVVGDIEMQPSFTVGEVVVDKDASLVDRTINEKPERDTLLGDTAAVANYSPDELRNIVLGGFSVARRVTTKTEVPLMPAQTVDATQKTFQVVVFPNPVQNGRQLTVTSKQNIDGNYQVYSMAGQLVKTGRVVIVEQHTFSIPVQNWPAGTYILRVASTDGAKLFTQKIMVQ